MIVYLYIFKWFNSSKIELYKFKYDKIMVSCVAIYLYVVRNIAKACVNKSSMVGRAGGRSAFFCQIYFCSTIFTYTIYIFIYFFWFVAGYSHNPYNGVVCNDNILATGVFSSKELWRLSKGREP